MIVLTSYVVINVPPSLFRSAALISINDSVDALQTVFTLGPLSRVIIPQLLSLYPVSVTIQLFGFKCSPNEEKKVVFLFYFIPWNPYFYVGTLAVL